MSSFSYVYLYMIGNFFRFFIKKTALIFLFFTITPITLFASAMSLIAITDTTTQSQSITTTSFELQRANVYTPSNNNGSFPNISLQVVPDDAREIIVKNYLEKENSPLLPYSSLIVQVSDKYGLDYRLLPAIAQKESGLCRVIPEGSHNCWGWGIHSKGTLMFDSYPEAIETVAAGLRKNYIDEGYVTPDQIMKKYAHPDSTTWAEGVSMYMDQLQ